MTREKKAIKECWWKQILVFIGLMVVLVVGYSWCMKSFALQENLEHLRDDDFSFVFQVDNVRQEGNNLVLDAWAFKLNKEAIEGAMELRLYDLQEEKIVYPIRTAFTERLDVNEYFLCEYNYTDCGIVASFTANKLSLEDKDYEILVSDMETEKIYQTGTYLSNGKLMYCLPEDYVPLDVVGTNIEKIVNEGVLRVYRPDVGMYVYQYAGELYWIAEPDYDFVEENVYIPFQINTTQIEKLPKEKLVYDDTWSNIGFWFVSKEILEENKGKYRVAKSELPLDYSIIKIWTGDYTDKWRWRQEFRPWYDFIE